MRCSPNDFNVTIRMAPDALSSGVDIGPGGLRYVGDIAQTADSTNETADSPRWCIEVEALLGGGDKEAAVENDFFAWTTAALLLPPNGLMEFARRLVDQDPERAAALRDGRLPGSSTLRVVLTDVMRRVEVQRLDWPGRTLWAPESDRTGIDSPTYLEDGRVAWLTFGPEQPWRVMQSRDGVIEAQLLEGKAVRPVFLTHHDREEDVMVAMWLPAEKRCKVWPAAWQGDWETTFEVDMTVMPTSWLRHGEWLWVLAPACTSAVKVDGDDRNRVITWDSGNALGELFQHSLHDGRWLTVPTVEQSPNGRMRRNSLQWIDLKQELDAVPIGCSARPNVCRQGEEFWFAGSDDVRCGRAGEATHVVRPGFAQAVLATEERVYVGAMHGGSQSLQALDRQTLRELWRLDDTPLPSTLLAIPGGIMLGSSTQFWLIRESGEVVYRSESRRELTWQFLPDGHFAVAAGEELAIVAPDGSLARTRLMPWDGVLGGVVGELLLYGPGTSGWTQQTPAGYWLLNHEGDTVAELPLNGPPEGQYVPLQTQWGGQGRLLAVSLFEGRMLSMLSKTHGVQELGPLRPTTAVETGHAESTQVPLPAWLRPPRSHEHKVGWHTTNPRDDWAEAGVVFRQEGAVCVRGSYGGTTGVCPGNSLALHDGASVVMLGCTLQPGGIEIHGDCTLWLIDCEVGDLPWSLGGQGRVVLVNCRVSGAPPVWGASAGGVWRPTAPESLIVRR